MENLKENKNKIEEIKKDNYNIKKKREELDNQARFLYNNNYEKFCENDKKIKDCNKKLELNNLKIAILKNNIHYLFRNDFAALEERMIDYWENKKIGEKTKEKIENEIKDFFRNNYDVNIRGYVSIRNDYYAQEFKVTLYFLDENNCKDYTLNYNEEFEIVLSKSSYNNYELVKNYYSNIVEYIELKDIEQKAKELLKDYNKTKEKIEKLRLQQKELYHNFSDYVHGFVYNELDIKTDIRIY
jgi:hypothetical protein